MDLLSRRSTDALLVEAEAVPSTESLRGGMVYTFGKRDYQVSKLSSQCGIRCALN